jgi:hypothetical protein
MKFNYVCGESYLIVYKFLMLCRNRYKKQMKEKGFISLVMGNEFIRQIFYNYIYYPSLQLTLKNKVKIKLKRVRPTYETRCLIDAIRAERTYMNDVVEILNDIMKNHLVNFLRCYYHVFGKVLSNNTIMNDLFARWERHRINEIKDKIEYNHINLLKKIPDDKFLLYKKYYRNK